MIKRVADNFQKLQEIVEEESELVKKIGEVYFSPVYICFKSEVY